MDINSQTPVKDIALADSNSRRVLEDAGVDYCCGGAKPLGEACFDAGVKPEEILKRLADQRNEAGPADAAWTTAPLAALTEHIREKHHRYVRGAIGRLRQLAGKGRMPHGENHTELADVEDLFHAVAREMSAHIQKEELVLFPYIEAVEKAANGGVQPEPPFFGTVKNPIHMMMREHDAAGDLVRQIRRASGEYRVPEDACLSYKTLYEELRAFEADLHQHVHLENNILFPRAVELEAAVLREGQR